MKENNFTNKIQTTVSLFFVIVVGTGCHGNETGMGGSNREVIIGSSTVSIGDGYFNKDGSCLENQLFSPAYDIEGKSALFEKMLYDDSAEALFLASCDGFFRFEEGDDAPQLIASLNVAIGQKIDFWKRGDDYIFPGSLLDGPNSVLKVLQLNGDEPSPRLNIEEREDFIPTNNSIDLKDDDVYWIQEHYIDNYGEDNIAYSVMKSKVTAEVCNSENTTIIYTAPENMSLNRGYLAGDSYFVRMDDLKREDGAQRYVQIDLESGDVVDEDTLKSRNGYVVGGDDDWLLFMHRYSELEGWGHLYEVLRMSPDGREQLTMEDELFDLGFSKKLNGFAHKDDLWVWADHGVHDSSLQFDDYYLFSHRPDENIQFVGCVNYEETSIHSMAIGDNALYVSILKKEDEYRLSDTGGTVFKYPLNGKGESRR